jgi:acyl transferase domain-containing protein
MNSLPASIDDAAIARRLADDPIAIVGVSCLFPEAPDVQNFWSNIVNRRDCITDVPETHWRIEDYYDPDPAAADKTYCKRGGFVPPTAFNPIEFGLPPTALDVTDVLQLLSMVVAKAALRDAGYEQRAFDRDRTGVILGITGANSLTTPLSTRMQYPVWRKVLLSRGFSDAQADDIIETIKKAYAPWEENSFPGMLGNVVAGRIANRLDFGGTNCTVDAACASSLSAMRMAIAELTDRRADMMLTGGCDAENTILMYMCFSKTPAFSKKGIIRPFDIESDGTLIGEGMGMLVLKRLADAERAGDRIYAVIRGLGSSSDGRFKSIYAPRAEGQIKCLTRAYADAGIAPTSVGLIEAHGTGTAVGDATEVGALRKVMAEDDSGVRHIALGSVKSQIGHTKAAAGAAGAIKTALALYHRVLPATINVTAPNPTMGFDDSPIYVNSQTRPWFTNYGVDKRYAGVSSFGFGGTNFHLVLEEYAAARGSADRLDAAARPVLIAAPTPEALLERIDGLRQSAAGDFPYDTGCAAGDARVGFVAADRAEYLSLLEIAATQLRERRDAAAWQHPRGLRYRRSAASGGKVAALFAGQGSQHVGMGAAAVVAYPPLHDAIAAFDGHFTAQGREALSARLYPIPAFDDATRDAQATALRDTRYAQPAIGALSAGQFTLLRDAGLRVDMVGGHSFGELTALWAAGALDDRGFGHLACARGEAMADTGAADPGTMIAIKASTAQVQAALQGHGDVWLCNINTPTQQVVGGTSAGIARLRESLKGAGLSWVDLPVSGAFHTPLLNGAAERFARTLQGVQFAAPRCAVYRNRDGQPYPQDAAEIRAGLGRQLLEPVQFVAMIETMYRDGARVFVEFGPKGLLSKMVGQILGDREHVVVELDRGNTEQSARHLMEAVVALGVAGVAVGNPDRWWRGPSAEANARKPGVVVLNGVNYVSEHRRKAYVDAVERGAAQRPSWAQAPASLVTATASIEPAGPAAVAAAPAAAVAVAGTATGAAEATATALTAQLLPPLDSHHGAESDDLVLYVLNRLRRDNLQLHDTYLDLHRELIAETLRLLGPDYAGALGDPAEVAKLPAHLQQIVRLMEENQAQTAAVHQKYLQQSRWLGENLDVPAAPPAIAAPSAPRNTAPARAAAAPAIAASVATVAVNAPHHTALHAPLPVHAGNTAVAAVASAAQLAQAPAPQLTPAPVAVVVPATPTPQSAAAAEQLLSVVADKTGYPADALELSMDMEADLGIDSIKRVEILGAMQGAFPAFVPPGPETLAELRTLSDILALIAGAAPAAAAAASPAAAQIATATAAVVTAAPVAATAVVETTSVLATPVQAAAVAESAVDTSAVATQLLSVVAEKTGYPADALELSMDMEADLGIDSIKRVEILGAMQGAFPAFVPPGPETLAELRTLGDILTLVAGADTACAAPAPAAPAQIATTTVVNVVPSAAISAVETTNVVTTAVQQTAGVAQTAVDTSAVATQLLAVVAEKTGYPADALELSMDMEADLGIDSIKRVEILGAMQGAFPSFVPPGPEALAELRTLGDILTLVAGADAVTPAAAAPAQIATATVVSVAPAAATPPVETTTVVTTAVQSVTAAVVDTSAVAAQLLAVVAEKTGYPADALELSMDMEADLGIDSIKRVEILGAMQGAFPAFVPPGPETLAELRTLGDILTLVAGADTASAAPAAAAAAPAQIATATVVSVAPGTAAPAVETTTVVTTTVQQTAGVAETAVDTSAVATQLLAVVAEKTGYPADALELSMDMEADLGIDSIKRVEILGAMQGAFPAFVPPGPETLAELRTLGDILTLVAGTDTASAAPTPAAPAQIATATVVSVAPAAATHAVETTTVVTTTVQQTARVAETAVDTSAVAAQLLAVVAEKTGYPADALELSMDMEADLGIDSIKRVEILGAMQGAFPAFVPPGPETLAELRTLGDILTLVAGTAQASVATAADSAVETIVPLSAATAPSDVGRYDQVLVPLAAPDVLLNAYRNGAQCVLVGDADALAAQIAQRLLRLGMRCTLLLPPGAAAPAAGWPADVATLRLDSIEPAAFEAALAPLGTLDAVLYLHPSFADHGLAAGSPGIARLKALFMLAKAAKPRLKAKDDGRTSFLAVARLDGTWGLEGLADGDLSAGAIPGLLKTLWVESEGTFCRAVDLAPAIAADRAAELLIDELHDCDNGRVNVAWSDAGRVGTALGITAPRAIAAPADAPVFVVTGGARGITAACVQALARRHRGRFLLLGRTDIATPEPAWAQGVPDAALKNAVIAQLRAEGGKLTPKLIEQQLGRLVAAREVRATLDALRALGAQAEYLDADITDASSAQALRRHPMIAAGGPIAVVHGAGALADKLIENKQLADFERVFGPKIHGLDALLSALPGERLSHLWLFSSVAGMFGNIGQSDYAMANELLNRIASRHRRRHPQCHVLSINWGAWNAGMVTPEVKAIFEQRGVRLIEVEEGEALFADALTQSPPQYGVMLAGSPMPLASQRRDARVDQHWQVRRSTAALAVSPLLQDHCIGGAPVVPAAFAFGWMAHIAERVLTGYTLSACRNFQVLNGLVADHTLPPNCDVRLECVDVREDGSIVLDATLVATADGRPHYRAQSLIFAPMAARTPGTAAPLNLSPAQEAAELYASGTLFHGPQFQLLQNYAVAGENQLVFTCRWQPTADPRLLSSHTAAHFCPMVADALLQAALTWVSHFERLPSLPMALTDLEVFGELPRTQSFNVIASLHETSSANSRLQLSAQSAEGEVYLRLIGSVVKSAALASKFGSDRQAAASSAASSTTSNQA